MCAFALKFNWIRCVCNCELRARISFLSLMCLISMCWRIWQLYKLPSNVWRAVCNKCVTRKHFFLPTVCVFTGVCQGICSIPICNYFNFPWIWLFHEHQVTKFIVLSLDQHTFRMQSRTQISGGPAKTNYELMRQRKCMVEFIGSDAMESFVEFTAVPA